MAHLELEDDTAQQLKAICAKYVALGYSNLLISYSGQGDSGDVDAMRLIGPDVEERALEDEEAKFFEYDLVDQLLEQGGFSGYENNDGGQGEMTLNLTTGEVFIEHGTNYISVEEETLTLTLFEEDEPAA